MKRCIKVVKKGESGSRSNQRMSPVQLWYLVVKSVIVALDRGKVKTLGGYDIVIAVQSRFNSTVRDKLQKP